MSPTHVSYDVRNLTDPAKYDHLVELESPAIWWNHSGPLGGLHLLNQVRVPYFDDVLGGFAGKRILDVGCGGGIFSEPLGHAAAPVSSRSTPPPDRSRRPSTTRATRSWTSTTAWHSPRHTSPPATHAARQLNRRQLPRLRDQAMTSTAEDTGKAEQ